MFEDIVFFKEKPFDLGFGRVHCNPDIVIAKGGSDELNRKLIEDKRTDILLDPEPETYDKLHYRSSGLNHVLCKLAKKNNVCIAFSFRRMLYSKNRALLFGKIMQNIKLCRKYKVNVVFGSFAENKWEMRSPHELKTLMQCLGMRAEEEKKSLSSVSGILERKKRFVKEGVEILD